MQLIDGARFLAIHWPNIKPVVPGLRQERFKTVFDRNGHDERNLCLEQKLCFPAHVVGGFTLSDLLDKPRPMLRALLFPPGTRPRFYHEEFRIPTAPPFSLNFPNFRFQRPRKATYLPMNVC